MSVTDETLEPLVNRLYDAAAGVIGWGVAQYPYLLGTHVRIDEAAAPGSTLVALAVVAAAALVVVVPAMALLFVLTQRGRLEV